MPQQPPQVPEQSGRMPGGSWDLPGRLRQDILSSWKRSLLAGLAPERFEVPHVTDVDEDGPLAWAAAPVMARLGEELEGIGIGILLADSRGHTISRRVRRAPGLACWTRSNWRRARCMPRIISGPTPSGPRSR